MEKKKLLLITISVGIFLVIAIGAALLLFAPKKAETPYGALVNSGENGGQPGLAPAPYYTAPVPSAPEIPGAAGSVQSAPVDAVDLVRSPDDVPGLKAPPEGSYRTGAEYHVNGSSQSGGYSETVISVPKPSTAAVPDTPPANRAVSAPAQKPAPKPVAAARPASSGSGKSAVQTKVYNDYWVQTGAFSTANSAEGVKETLASKGIASIIENRDVDGKTLFRVRVGPYTSKNEADYWLSLIKTIGGFEDSQVRQTQSRR